MILHRALPADSTAPCCGFGFRRDLPRLDVPLHNTRHTDTVASAGFSVDGSLAASGCYGGLLKVWEASTGTLKHVLEGPEDIECLT